jgi:pimeloyl-ACP methyl ester carboxylesterase
MKRDDTFSGNEASPSSSPEQGGDRESHGLSSPPPLAQDAPSSALLPGMDRRWTSHHRMRVLAVALVLVVLVASVGGYGIFRTVSQLTRQTSSAFHEAHCPFPLGAALVEGQNVRCGFLSVPEDWSRPQGPTLRLAVAIFKTFSSHPAPDPVLSLGGGPGQSWLATMGPTYNAGNLLPNRDLILFDQRGAGYSQPSLRCFDNETLHMCHDRLVKSGINLNAYTTLQNAADVHALIRTLGYRQVNLQGGSYGSRLALTVMRLYPSDLRSVVLDAVVPAQVNVFTGTPQATIRAFDVLFHRCGADPSCNASYPHLQTVFYRLAEDLNATPITFQMTLQTGKSGNRHFTGNDLVLWLQNALKFTAAIPLLPEAIFEIRQHDYTLLSRLLSLIDSSNSNTTGSWGMFYSVMCGEDAAFITPETLQTSVEGLPPQAQPALLQSSMSVLSVCQFWGVKPVPAIQKEPVRSSIPTLILQGEYDPLTAPSYGIMTAQTLNKSYFFLLPGVGHLIHSPTSTCPDTIPEAFWDHPTEKPDASCINSMVEPVFR